MDLPTPPAALAVLANLVRHRLAQVQAARQLAVVLVSAASPFASNSYARTRLLRQMHAAGLLTEPDPPGRIGGGP